MLTTITRTQAVRRALATIPASPTSSELDILTRFALGYLSQSRANELLRAQGRELRLPAEQEQLCA